MVNPFMPGDRTRPASFGQTVSYKTSFYTSKDFQFLLFWTNVVGKCSWYKNLK